MGGILETIQSNIPVKDISGKIYLVFSVSPEKANILKLFSLKINRIRMMPAENMI